MKPEEFEDLKIVGIDVNRAMKPKPDSHAYLIPIKLSAMLPEQWENILKDRWEGISYTIKPPIAPESPSGCILVKCPIEELERHHIDALAAVIKDTNRLYREYLEKEERKRKAQENELTQARAKLQEISERLKKRFSAE